ncbi:hypothetical protein VTK73DRAFT_4167 [Phialemonium thermophilum]|uniref:Major facilitator superfamily (MFS) profile domain-containing protein n=1 Tax=Phialemonium thermophilum TaxID=223376 RepID=A0ABR3Y0H9_9PEZI
MDPSPGQTVKNGRQSKVDYGTVSNPAGEASTDAPYSTRETGTISIGWSKWSLTLAYLGVFLMAFITSLEGQVTFSLSAFAVSSFHKHSLLSTVYVVQGVVNAVIKPPMAKIADVFGRLEAFSFSILLYVLGYVQMACSQNVETYASAQIFYSSGSTGLQILQQIFIADTSSLLNRALFSSLPDTPFLATVWIGPVIASCILSVASWRWGYGMWAIVLPLAFLPLALSLLVHSRKVKRSGLYDKEHRWRGPGSLRRLFTDLDILGILLLSTGLVLILVPLTLASRAERGWYNHGIITMIILGVVFLGLFVVCESRPSLAPHPLIPPRLLHSRTFCAGLGIGFFYFMVFYLSVQPYFYSYLLVVQNQTVAAAGQITQTFSFSSTVSAILVSLGIKRARRYKMFVVGGSVLSFCGICLMIYYRTEGASVPQLVVSQAALGAGCGIMHVSAQLAVQASATHSDRHDGQIPGSSSAALSAGHVASATAAFLTLVQVGGATGSAVSGAVWGRILPCRLYMYLPPAARPHASEIYASVVEALKYPRGGDERRAIDRAYQETMTTLLVVALCMCIPVVLLSLLVEDYQLDDAVSDTHMDPDGVVVGGTGEVVGVGIGERLAEDGGKRWWHGWNWSGEQTPSQQPLLSGRE